ALRATHMRYGPDPLDKLTRIEAAFYGDLLEQLSSVKVSSEAIALGAEQASEDFDAFAVSALQEMALRLGATESDIEAEVAETTVPQGAGVNKKWVKALARVIERLSPFKGTLFLRVLGQAHAYIRNAHVHDE